MHHSSAIISRKANIGSNVTIGAFSIVEDDVVLGDNVILSDHVLVKRGSVVESGCKIFSFAVIGEEPQMKIPVESGGVLVGRNSILREGVTVHRSSKANTATKIGENCFLMAYSHVAHDCNLGNDVTLANGALLGGYVEVESHAFISGNAVVHQFVKIGESSFLSGNSSVSKHVPPFCVAINRNQLNGINVTGLKRRKFERSEISDIYAVYKLIKNRDGSFKSVVDESLRLKKFNTCKGRKLLEFFSCDSYGCGFLSVG